MRVWIALLTVLTLASAACARAQRKPADPVHARMDVRLRALAASGADTVAGVFIRTTHPIGAREREQLEHAGARIGTVTGALLTARIPARDLYRVATLPFVEYIESSARLRPQGKVRPPANDPSSDGVA